MAVTNYPPVPHNIPEEGRPQLCCGPDVILHIMYEYCVCVCVYVFLRDATIMQNIFSLVLSVAFNEPFKSLL